MTVQLDGREVAAELEHVDTTTIRFGEPVHMRKGQTLTMRLA